MDSGCFLLLLMLYSIVVVWVDSGFMVLADALFNCCIVIVYLFSWNNVLVLLIVHCAIALVSLLKVSLIEQYMYGCLGCDHGVSCLIIWILMLFALCPVKQLWMFYLNFHTHECFISWINFRLNFIYYE